LPRDTANTSAAPAAPASASSRRDAPARPPLAHPLCGADLGTLGRAARRFGFASPRRSPKLALAWAAAAARWPSTAIERRVVDRRIAKGHELPPTIFILGHWRSGTTHLYNVMAKAPRFGYVSPITTGLPWDALGIGRALRPLLERMLPDERWIDPIPVRPDSPQEDEPAIANMDTLSFYHGLYCPRQLQRAMDEGLFLEGVADRDLERWKHRFVHLLHKLAMLQPEADTLLIKNPVYTARVALLREMLPGARFIHIHRHPYEVFRSMRNFWQRLLEALSLQPFEHVDIDELVLSTYPRLMQRLVDETADLPSDRFIELTYDELSADATAAIGRIYDQLGIGGFDADRSRFEAYLDTVKSYRKQRYEMDESTKRRIDERWGEWMQRWGYETE
jgi:omega-hydroxy-beta-dihydromenaquinone-9 sulfotransferase